MNTTTLKRKVLEKLQVIANGEPVNAADGVLVQDKYQDLHEILLQSDLVEWVVSEDIPDAYGNIVVALVAAECVDEFHCPDGLKVKILLEGKYNAAPASFAERQLRKLAARGPNDEPAESEYF